MSGCVASPESRNAADTVRRPAPVRPSPSPTPPWNPRPASVAAVGDSITRGFDACGLLTDCPEASWATGSDTRVNSLALRLLGAPALAARSWNLARSGARVAELPEQMALAARKDPGLVTVMVGANDACRPSADLMTPVADFRASFEAAMARLRRAAPRAQVYVASVPDLQRLWSTGRDHPVGQRVWRLGVCASMLADAHDLGPAAQERRERVRERVVAYNEVLREVCARDERCRHDGGAVFAYVFDGTQLSPWDAFHPSRDGQGRLAEIAYRTVTAARPPA
ncbi:GDSL-type esterase/lipase family protein [Streptomyces sp. TRM76323]|uniref:GDSL-type esterase/lipase family protein n=1 Tax=Streptomyces tamarix TaxID=3078565 RepID=A0ABU3QQ75_9ACTN|nr:SGNH/GDSL hydrolase family protein [Streptomyces tamarix]MDT9684903.1 GDSL-type esterase/lipase family protein [Streptomyces tamarix]